MLPLHYLRQINFKKLMLPMCIILFLALLASIYVFFFSRMDTVRIGLIVTIFLIASGLLALLVIRDLLTSLFEFGKTLRDKQQSECQVLFDYVPGLITVQDKNFRILRCNREFNTKFEPRPLD